MMNIFQRLASAWRISKALADVHPELQAREHIAVMRSDETVYSPYSYLSAVANYNSYVWVRKAVNIIAENFASLTVYVERDSEYIGHPAEALLTTINDTMSSSDLWQQWAIDMLLGGEEFWELVKDGSGRYVEIWPRQPHVVKIVPDAQRLRYRAVVGYKIGDDMGDGYTLAPDECVHFKFYNPADPWRGISPISAVRSSVIIDQLAQAWSRQFLGGSARPDYAVTAPQGTTKTERDNLLAEIKSRYGGTANAHEPIVLEDGVTDIKILSFPPKDIEWVEQRKLSRAEVAAIFGVPDEIMGYGRDTYENFGIALKVLWTLTIQPLAQLRDTHLTEFFQRYGVLAPGERIVTGYEDVEAFADDFGAKLDQATKLFGMGVPFNTIDEILELGVGSLTGGDIGYLPLSLVPVTSSGPRLPAPADNAPESLAARRARTKAIDYGSAEHKTLWDAFIARVDPHETAIGAAVRELLVAQGKEVLTALVSEKAFSSNGHSAIEKSIESVAANPFNVKEWIKRFRDKCDPLIARTVDAAGQAAAADLGTMFSLEDPSVVRFLQAREQRFAQRVNDTTWQQLKDTLSEGVHLGEGIPKLEQRIADTMTLRKNQSKETIARTEVIGASNGGTLESWKQAEIVSGKTWIATFDDRVRDTHAEAHGQTVGIEENFTVGAGSGPAPGQIGLAAEDCNCRCTMIAVLK